MASYSGSSFISWRGKKRRHQEDLRSMIACKKAATLRIKYVGVIGAEFTGRNTLVRRFAHMSDGPFTEPEAEKFNRRTVFIELGDRPSIRQVETVKIDFHILNGRTRSHNDMNIFIPSMRSIALVFDTRSERTLNIATSCANRIRAHLGDKAPPFILVGNKIDLPEVPGGPMINIAARDCGAEKYYKCSARENLNMDPVLDAILIKTFFPDRPLPE